MSSRITWRRCVQGAFAFRPLRIIAKLSRFFSLDKGEALNLFALADSSVQDTLLYDHQSGEMVEKFVFVAFLQGDNTYNKVKRICDVVGANVYEYDESNLRSEIEVRAAMPCL